MTFEIEIHLCTRCGVRLTSENTYPSAFRRYSYFCKECCNQDNRKHYAQNREYMRIRNRQRLQKKTLNSFGIPLVLCPVCDSKFKNWRGVSAHIYQCHKERKFCHTCHVELTSENRGDYKPSRHHPTNWCLSCRRKYHRDRGNRLYKIPKERIKFLIRSHRYLDKQRANLLGLLGDRCVCCGFDNPLALQIDHVHDDGARERAKYRTNKNGRLQCAPAYYRNILKKLREGSEDYQLLCANCNMIKRRKNELEKRNQRKLSLVRTNL